MAQCKHEIEERWCSWCKKLKDPEILAKEIRAQLLAAGWKEARYPGTCANCSKGEIEPGMAITLCDRGWKSECCAELPELHAGFTMHGSRISGP